MNKCLLFVLLTLVYRPIYAQAPDEDELGAWYMYFFTKKIGSKGWGVQGDFQYRSWNLGSDREQLLLRSGITYRPKNADILFTLGYAFISTGAFGESKSVFSENRLYQEVLIPNKIGNRFLLTHRFRYEQRWVANQDLRTRFRYNLFLNIPLNKTKLTDNTIYLATYNELFINGERSISPTAMVEYFDRNRTYLGLGYAFTANLRVQGGWMKQTTASWAKDQLQVSLHHNF